MKACTCSGADPCRACERRAEARTERQRDEIERPDQFGRDPDWHFPRGYGGLG